MKNTAKDQALRFIAKFLAWYQDSYSMPEVVNRLKLEQIVKEAEQIHVLRIQEIDKEYKASVLPYYQHKPTKMLKKKVKEIFTKTKGKQVKEILDDYEEGPLS